ncbi:UdgX family uracil-DNA binding protein [Amycolatopsis sp. K13G38]|uniref:Type-4 uracil-DNA glycosylase n=1 Tax=Amycolatopsis acididurans TaxID=2724524 RepID=A0ABX1IZS5_9PSEU|nr:UdgX family uracil-DNA binding protein [Amycolatopsis acididurans]NKQ53022.1 UdgX family uracil-DNA binding protein [Amycolatopsis acididurans]
MPATAKRDASPFVPDSHELSRLREASLRCAGCDLYQDATQTVFGAGPANARVLMLGEQPGDREDREGEPFVGPAGRLLDRALAEAGIDRDEVYVTNAVKHFKFVRAERGKQRIHKKPSRGEVVACRPWLLAELDSVRPELVVLLGATAAQSLMGPSFRVTAHRGERLDAPGEFDGRPEWVVPTVHPSSVLRAPDRDDAYAALVADLRAAA